MKKNKVANEVTFSGDLGTTEEMPRLTTNISCLVQRLFSIKSLKYTMAAMTGLVLLGGETYAAPNKYVNIQPIQVCDDASVNCAPVNLFRAETKKIWEQANIDVNFLPLKQINNGQFLTIDSDDELNQLATGAGNGQNPFDTTLNFWFINTIANTSGGVTFGQVNSIGSNGTVISSAVFNPNTNIGRIDTVAHELGHNLTLEHNGLGAGPDNPNNLMTAGRFRQPANSIDNINPNGEGKDQLTSEQIAQAKSSLFANIIPNITLDTIGSTPFDTDNFFHVAFRDGPSKIALKSISIDLSPVNAFFDPTNVSPGLAGSPFKTSSLNGISSREISVSGDIDGSQLLTLNFEPGVFGIGKSFDFGIDVDLFSNIDGFGALPSELIGSIFRYEFTDGYTLSSALDENFIASSLNSISLSKGFSPLNPVINVNSDIVVGDDPPSTRTSVPESSSFLAIWAIGILGSGSIMKRKLKLSN